MTKHNPFAKDLATLTERDAAIGWLTYEAQTKDDEIERLNTTIRRVNHLLDARWGSSAELDDLIDDIHSTIAGKP